MSINETKQDRFLRLLAPVQESLERFALFLTRNREDARDLVSETLLHAYSKLESLRDEITFQSFIFTIARRTFYNLKSRTRRFEHIEHNEIDELFCGGGIAPDVAIDVQFLYKALDSLSDVQREAVIMAEIMGFSHKEIQKIQGGTVTGVKVRIYRAKKQLAKILGAGIKPDSLSEEVIEGALNYE
ncbi:MAG: RNA polymerase sigma factor [Bacteroidetes bacterium]|nr:RNA polymerase sigma factor [Bacteroidota bacterium]